MKGFTRLKSNQRMDGLLSDIVPKVIEVKLNKQTKKELAIGAAIYAVVSAALIGIAVKISN